MTRLFARLPPIREINRDLLLVGVTLLVWVSDLAWDLVAYTALNPPDSHPWQHVIAPRVLRHALLLPLLVGCYMAAMRVSRFTSRPLLAGMLHFALGLAFAGVARLVQSIAFYLITGNVNLAGTHFSSILDASFSLAAWLTTMLVYFMVYMLGLFILLGLNAQLDLENERNRTSELYALWLNARLDTLRGQLNPHFLFNSLHTISSLLFTDTRRADKLLADLSDVLRTTLREGQREFTTVREELDYARRYLSIEETRFEDRLMIRYAVDETSLGARVPSLILQPLIENAIKYGISSSAGANSVTVEVRRGGDTLVMEVSNDFRSDTSPVSPDKKMGIGLNNVRERLMAIYGADYTLSSLPLPGNRWSTRISLPYQEALGA